MLVLTSWAISLPQGHHPQEVHLDHHTDPGQLRGEAILTKVSTIFLSTTPLPSPGPGILQEIDGIR